MSRCTWIICVIVPLGEEAVCDFQYCNLAENSKSTALFPDVIALIKQGFGLNTLGFQISSEHDVMFNCTVDSLVNWGQDWEICYTGHLKMWSLRNLTVQHNQGTVSYKLEVPGRMNSQIKLDLLSSLTFTHMGLTAFPLNQERLVIHQWNDDYWRELASFLLFSCQ